VARRVEAGDLFRVVDVLDELAAETGRSVAQVALNWLLSRPTVASFGLRSSKPFWCQYG
jgi:aryl-alcohol dehydrogenase-like predicted oxidoreductase